MKVVITGGAGFIGSNLARYWAATHPDDELVILDALTYAGVRESIEDLLRSNKATLARADVCDREAVHAVLDGASLVLHLAAETHVDRSIADPMPFVRTNVVGTQTLLEEARRLDLPRFHHVSTDEVFGSLPLEPRGQRFGLTTPYDPHSPYAASKAASDHLVRAYFATYGLAATLSNCGNNYGPYQHPEKLIPNFITRLLFGHKLPLYGDGANVRDWIHVEDHCRALDVISHRGAPGATYLVGADQERSNLEVTHALLRAFGKDDHAIERVSDRLGHDRRYAIDSSFLRESLGWSSLMSFDDGLVQTIQWYREHDAWWRPLLPPAMSPT
jgi:dTDP-glucose 4,6-dehydratase